MKASLQPFVLAIVALLAACGGGGGGGATPPGGGGGGTPTPIPTATPTPGPTATPIAQGTEAPPINTSVLASSWSRIAPIQVFDDFRPKFQTFMTASQVSTDGTRYAGVWGSFQPQLWAQYHSSIPTSDYYIPPEDSNKISGHDINYWLQNNPTWIMYACDSTGAPTMHYAYAPGVGFADVPLNLHNPAVVQYQIQSLMSHMVANHYKAAALDLVLFRNVMVGPNPILEPGQSVISGYYGCGYYSQFSGNPPAPVPSSFVKVYDQGSAGDSEATADIQSWVSQLHAALHANGLQVWINHPIGTPGDPKEAQLLQNEDMTFTETGFSDYGNYKVPGSTLFPQLSAWMEYVQHNNVAIGIIDKWDQSATVQPSEVEYSIATYLESNEQGAYLYMAPYNANGIGYGAEQWHPEYATQMGTPCAPQVRVNGSDLYTRKFSQGFVAVNAGTTNSTVMATIPSNHTYTDLEGRPVTNPLSIAPFDAYVLVLQGSNTGCL